MKSKVEVPEYMLSTVAMLRRAYPESIPDSDRLSLMAVLSDAGMSNRSVAAAVGYYHGRPYTDYSYEANICSVDESVTDLSKFAVREHLRRFGFDEWEASLD